MRRPSLDQSGRSEEHTSELQSLAYLVCRLLLEKKNGTASDQDCGTTCCRAPSFSRAPSFCPGLPGPLHPPESWVFFFNHAAPAEIYTLSLHDALPIFGVAPLSPSTGAALAAGCVRGVPRPNRRGAAGAPVPLGGARGTAPRGAVWVALAGCRPGRPATGGPSASCAGRPPRGGRQAQDRQR